MTEPTEPTREEMITFLRDHFRYYTMSSVNRSTSYARNVKIHNLHLTREQESKAYDLIYAEGAYGNINQILEDFAINHDQKFQIGFNGRSSGYLVLYQGGQKPSGYQSYCTRCGQLNYKKVLPKAECPEDEVRNYIRTHNFWVDEALLRQPEVARAGLTNDEVLKIIREVREEIRRTDAGYTDDNKCGGCGRLARKNFDRPHMQTYSQPGLGMDMDADFEDEEDNPDYWIKQRYQLVKEFDQTVDDCIACFKSILDECNVVEKTVMVPKKVMVLECAHQEE